MLPLLLLIFRVRYRRFAPWWAILLADFFVGWILYFLYVIFEDRHKMNEFHAYEGKPPQEMISDVFGKGEATLALFCGG